jgi:hypothetical protein
MGLFKRGESAPKFREPKGIEFGVVPKTAFDKMEVADIQHWLDGRFHDAWDDYCPSVVDIGGQTSWVREKYTEFSPDVRQRFADALLNLFDELAAEPKKWKDKPVTEQSPEPHSPSTKLFIFAANTLLEHTLPETQQKLQPKMLAIMESASTTPNQKIMAANMLVGLEYEAEDRFWLELGKRIPDSAEIVFSGIAIQHPQAAFAFLAEQPWHTDPSKGTFALIAAFAETAERHGEEVVDKGIALLAEKHPEAKSQIAEIKNRYKGIMREMAKEGRQ